MCLLLIICGIVCVCVLCAWFACACMCFNYIINLHMCCVMYIVCVLCIVWSGLCMCMSRCLVMMCWSVFRKVECVLCEIVCVR